MGSTRHSLLAIVLYFSNSHSTFPILVLLLRCPFAILVVPMPLAADAVRMAAFCGENDDGDGSCALSMMCNVTNGKERESL